MPGLVKVKLVTGSRRKKKLKFVQPISLADIRRLNSPEEGFERTAMKSKDDADLDFLANPIDKPGYRLEFGDNFQEVSLDTGKWLSFYRPQWSNRNLAAAHYSLPGNCLRLHIEADQPPWCPDYDDVIRVSSWQTGCFSGPVGSAIGQHKFKPDLVVAEAQPTRRYYTPRIISPLPTSRGWITPLINLFFIAPNLDIWLT